MFNAMSEESFDCKSRLGEAEGRCLYSGDSRDNRKRRKVQYQDEREEVEEEEDEYLGENSDGISLPSSSNEQIDEVSIDRLSALPDSLLIHILSFLYMQEAVRTAVLSKRWKFLWTDLPKFEFSEMSRDPEETWKFVGWVNRTLVICNRNHLEKFEVNFHYDKSFASDVNSWVQFVVKNKVKDVGLLLSLPECLLLSPPSDVMPDYMLPQMMYANSCLTHLSLHGCIMAPRTTIEWGTLTKLSLSCVELREHVVEEILSGCPVLYDLTLWKCWGLNRLEVNSQILHVLQIAESHESNEEQLMQISAPYVRSLVVLLDIEGRKFRLTNISSVVTAKIEILGAPWEAKSLDYTEGIFENLQHVKKLELGEGIVEAIAELLCMGWRVSQSAREHLIVKAPPYIECIPAIVSLLESSPLLETLVIYGCSGSIGYKDYMARGPPPTHFKESDLNCDLSHLKTVHIKPFRPPCFVGEPVLTVALILLKRATVLEKMVIEKGVFFDSSSSRNVTSMEIARTLLSYPRSSPKAVLLYNE